ncbi:hypothetical protein F2Q70_00045480 [Brassica cretica]|uniref:Uncharacterized protein n=1 Tax=Brassica cretica TaxID=69181 RepID=A0A8S9KH52_BRACR|nr:hypothetical protein F2Q70_00045480 [Brassica cretica]
MGVKGGGNVGVCVCVCVVEMLAGVVVISWWDDDGGDDDDVVEVGGGGLRVWILSDQIYAARSVFGVVVGMSSMSRSRSPSRDRSRSRSPRDRRMRSERSSYRDAPYRRGEREPRRAFSRSRRWKCSHSPC